MTDYSYDDALDAAVEKPTAENMEVAARFAEAASALLALLAPVIAALAELPPPDPETIRELDRRMTIELLRRGVIR